MMTTTMKNVPMMVEIAVETMLVTCIGTSTVLYVNVWIQMVNQQLDLQDLLQIHVDFNGYVISML